MYACVRAEFRMECCDQRLALGNRHWIVTLTCNRLHFWADARNLWGADEDHFNWRPAEYPLANRTIDLPPVGVPPDADIDCTQPLLSRIFNFPGQQDGACARAKCWFKPNKLFQSLETGFAKKFQKRARLAAGDHQPIDLIELLGLLDQDNFRPKLFQPSPVRVEVALQC